MIDRGLLYFAKFVGAIVLLVFAFATAYFGFDMNKAREGVEQMRKEVQESQRAVEETKQSVVQIKK